MRTSRVHPTTRGMLRSTIIAMTVIIAAAAVSVKLLQPDPRAQRRSPGPVHLPATPAGDAAAITKAPKARKVSMETIKGFASRDPFEPLIEDPSATSAGEEPTGAKDTGTANDEAQTTAGEDNDVEAGEMIADTNTSEGEALTEGTARNASPDPSMVTEGPIGASDRLPIRLVTIRQQRRAVVRVGGVLHRPTEGERFATNFEILSIRDDCASLLYGDEQFMLCKGQGILK